MIGNHRDISAFTQNIEVSHTHHLEQRLAARSKLIEGSAQVLDAPRPSTVTSQDRVALPGAQVVAETYPVAGPSEIAGIEDERAKRLLSAEVKRNENALSEETRFASDGAPGYIIYSS